MAGFPDFRLGTRGSPLALAQAHEARRRLAAALGWEEARIAVVVIKTTGDMIQDRALSEAGGKGLFTKELDTALLDGAIDCAIHSAKDLPTFLPDGLFIAGYLPREDVRDALITAGAPGTGASALAALPHGAVIGTASLRRQAQLRRLRPDFEVRLLRGNVGTRLGRVESGEYAATLLAMAGLNRLGLAHHATAVLGTDDFLPAVGQGAIAITARVDDPAAREKIATIVDAATTTALTCERAFLTILDGSCRTPIAGHAVLSDGLLRMKGLVLTPDGARGLETVMEAPLADATALGEAAAGDLLARGARELLAGELG